MAHSTAPRSARGAHQWLALIVGVVFLLVGAVGFIITGFSGFMEHDDSQTLLGFAINPLHNAVHLLIGILGVSLWASSVGARIFGWLLLLIYGAAFVYGLYAVDNPEIDYLNTNDADNWLHLGGAVVGLLIAIWPARKRVLEQPGTTETMPRDVR
jgi:ABC-type transport system involved in multi-copper enzyme maturation permease subunit